MSAKFDQQDLEDLMPLFLLSSLSGNPAAPTTEEIAQAIIRIIDRHVQAAVSP